MELEQLEQFKKVKEAQGQITEAWLQSLIQLLWYEEKINPKLEDLTYWKTTVESDASTYLLTLQHVRGPKFKLRPDSDSQQDE